ncbi:2302_t:CDS:1, partial [Acaulospora morrowiae]
VKSSLEDFTLRLPLLDTSLEITSNEKHSWLKYYEAVNQEYGFLSQNKLEFYVLAQ